MTLFFFFFGTAVFGRPTSPPSGLFPILRFLLLLLGAALFGLVVFDNGLSCLPEAFDFSALLSPTAVLENFVFDLLLIDLSSVLREGAALFGRFECRPVTAYETADSSLLLLLFFVGPAVFGLLFEVLYVCLGTEDFCEGALGLIEKPNFFSKSFGTSTFPDI